MPNPRIPSYGSLVVNGQLVPVLTSPAFRPAPGVGPIYQGPGYAPLATLPSGPRALSGTTTNAPYGGGGASGGGNLSGLHVGILLAVIFVVGILWLHLVHWEPGK